MQRREFLRQGSLALAAPLLASLPAHAAGARPLAPMDRIGITTVSLRTRFPSTRAMGGAGTPLGPDLTPLTAPGFIVEQLGIRNVELWDLHFEDLSLEYMGRVREAAERAGARISNVQLDGGPYNLSHADPAERAKALAYVKAWMDRARALGAASVRANTGGGRNQTFDVAVTAGSFRELADYGERLGLKVLVENHGGFSSDPDNIVAILRAVDRPNVRSLPDYGNMPIASIGEQVAFLRKILPWAELISAKGGHFDAEYRHTDYDIGALVRASEEGGFRGIYSIELWVGSDPPADPVRAARSVMQTILANLQS